MKYKAKRGNALITPNRLYDVHIMKDANGELFYRVLTGIEKCPHHDINYMTFRYYFGEYHATLYKTRTEPVDERFEYGCYC